jgi:hypothetical protein
LTEPKKTGGLFCIDLNNKRLEKAYPYRFSIELHPGWKLSVGGCLTPILMEE